MSRASTASAAPARPGNPMPGPPQDSAAPVLRLPSRRDPVVRQVALQWRRLTGGGAPTIVACSGGADSSALAIALAAAGGAVTLAYVRHPIRAPAVVNDEAEAVAQLAGAIGAGFAEAAIAATDRPLSEAQARAARYACLQALARKLNIGLVATGHHAEDQLESMVMALSRGAGPWGMAGMPAARRLQTGSLEHCASEHLNDQSQGLCFQCKTSETSEDIGSESRPTKEREDVGSESPPTKEREDVGSESRPTKETVMLIRPMLTVRRAEAEALCTNAGYHFRSDATNADHRYLRNAMRHGPLASLIALCPEAPRRAADAASLLRDAAELVRERAEIAFGFTPPAGWGGQWPRCDLRRERAVVVGEGLRQAAIAACGGGGGDSLPQRLLMPAIRAIRSASTDPKQFDWPNGLVLTVTAHSVQLRSGEQASDADSQPDGAALNAACDNTTCDKETQ